mmetsp:Transcript_218/g.851  ORF Transcript_218/g.851 Transcript_218/m.851 type:complete len:216 (+) Transcript_218:112-759(+)
MCSASPQSNSGRMHIPGKLSRPSISAVPTAVATSATSTRTCRTVAAAAAICALISARSAAAVAQRSPRSRKPDPSGGTVISTTPSTSPPPSAMRIMATQSSTQRRSSRTMRATNRCIGVDAAGADQRGVRCAASPTGASASSSLWLLTLSSYAASGLNRDKSLVPQSSASMRGRCAETRVKADLAFHRTTGVVFPLQPVARARMRPSLDGSTCVA